MHSKCYLPDMSHGYAFMQHFTDISIFSPLKKESTIYEHKQHECEKMESFLEPLRQFFTFTPFLRNIRTHKFAFLLFGKNHLQNIFFFSVPSNTTPTHLPKKHILFYRARSVLWHRQKHFFFAKGICEQEKLMLLKAPHIFFFSIEKKVCAILQKKKKKAQDEGTEHNKYNLVMRNL